MELFLTRQVGQVPFILYWPSIKCTTIGYQTSANFTPSCMMMPWSCRVDLPLSLRVRYSSPSTKLMTCIPHYYVSICRDFILCINLSECFQPEFVIDTSTFLFSSRLQVWFLIEICWAYWPVYQVQLQEFCDVQYFVIWWRYISMLVRYINKDFECLI